MFGVLNVVVDCCSIVFEKSNRSNNEGIWLIVGDLFGVTVYVVLCCSRISDLLTKLPGFV